MNDHPPCQATPPGDLRNQIMSSLVPKNEREHWAARHIGQIERQNAKLEDGLKSIRRTADETYLTLPAGNSAIKPLGQIVTRIDDLLTP